MKLFIVGLALFAVAFAQDAEVETLEEIGEKYTTKFDKIDLDDILKSDRLFKNYYNCLMEEGPCTPEGNYLKRVLPEALENSCNKCSEKQQKDSVKAIKYLTENRSEAWKVLKAKYDPENKYVEKYLTDADAEGIKL
ncbi:serine/threonine kinase [Culex quinquefasciatus]|uniref:Serine/threonine kinase n=1 Tax=Culex quinquefasciatus TaxID=7176 RepID=B0W7K1_CULQU|nr:ejaculatory bulb-specific protein 3 [Culex quinquefasciatus]EDS38036.1 serine/threonine kinase [Culex quinquefasciatus]|eukprot:XP_001844685.1 serine/threonine kinase [Culex quinquefasciatus]